MSFLVPEIRGTKIIAPKSFLVPEFRGIKTMAGLENPGTK